jgi:hypothetical protein
VEQRTLTAADVDERSNSEKSNAATVAGRADDDIAVIIELKLQHKFSVHRPSNTWRNIQRMVEGRLHSSNSRRKFSPWPPEKR